MEASANNLEITIVPDFKSSVVLFSAKQAGFSFNLALTPTDLSSVVGLLTNAGLALLNPPVQALPISDPAAPSEVPAAS
jgi:hypothetical protein